MQNRRFDHDVLKQIRERWSTYAFSPEKVPIDDILAVLEAARFAPSCFNEQPWRFLVAREDAELERMSGLLAAKNYVWAVNAPVLIMVCAKSLFHRNGKENYWHMFDTGAAYGFLMLEANKRGYATHPMGGFDRDKAAQIYRLDDDIKPICILAMGRCGDPEMLPDELKAKEAPSARAEIANILLQPIYNENEGD